MLEVTQVKMVAANRSPSGLTDDEALDMLFQVNTPNAHSSWSRGPSHTPASATSPGVASDSHRTISRQTKRTARGGGSTSSGLTAARSPSKDDDGTRTSQAFWEEWAVEATASLLSDMDTEVESKELVFSGRVGPEPKYQTLRRVQSSESVATDISLFNCSDLYLIDVEHQARKLKKRKGKPKAPAVNWELFARERKGVLDRFIQADASKIEGYMKNRSGPIQNVTQKTVATDMMTKQECQMLMQCAYSHGPMLVNDVTKSCSTENIVTVVKNTQQQRSRFKSLRVTWKNDASGSNSKFPSETELIRLTESMESPGPIVESLHEHQRAQSAMPALNPNGGIQVADRMSSAANRSSCYSIFPAQITPFEKSTQGPQSHRLKKSRRQSMGQSLPDLDGVFSCKVKRKISSTLADLTRATGFGDRTDASVQIEEEQGVYTDTDYARHPRYPQHIRIAPHLSKIIRDDIRDRMGRPLHHEIKLADLEAFNNDQPLLGRSHRNLLIFNWLNEVTETPYEYLKVPGIADLEGAPSHRAYPKFKPGIVGRKEDNEQQCDDMPTASSENFNDDDVINSSDTSGSDFDSND